MKGLVTGASGFLATNTIIKLLENKIFVRALTRNKSKIFDFNSTNLQIIESDLKFTNTIEKAVKGCDFIIHIAAETRQGLTRYNNYKAINIDFTKTLCEIALKYHVKKFIYVGTANVFGYGSNLNPGNGKLPVKKPFSNSFYVRSKIKAQETVLSYKKKFDVVVVNPTFMVGPYDNKQSSVRFLRSAFYKKIIFFPPGGKNFVSVTDVAAILVSALNQTFSEQILIAANENLSYKEFFLKASKISNTIPILIPIPAFILLALGFLGELLKMIRIRNDITLNNMRILCVKNFYSNQNSVEKLGFAYKPIDKALFETFKWMSKRKK